MKYIFIAASFAGFYFRVLPWLKEFWSPDFCYDSSGTIDFAPYWVAINLFVTGADPYSLKDSIPLLLSVEHEKLFLMSMLNPPWFLVLISPLYFFDFVSGARAWACLNIGLMFLCTVLIWRLCEAKRNVLPVAIAFALIFFPFWEVIAWGQSSLFPATGLVLLASGIKGKKAFVGGMGLVLMTIKPHICFLIFPIVLLWVIREKQYHLLKCAFLIFSAVLGVKLFINPHSLVSWLSMLSNPNNADLSYTLGTRSTTIGWWGKEIFGFYGLFVIPALSITTTLIYFWKRGHFDLGKELPWLVIVSYITAPYGWTHDQVVLILPCLIAVIWAFQSRDEAKYKQGQNLDCDHRRLRVSALLLLLLQLLLFVIKPFLPHAYLYSWVPFVVLALWIYSSRSFYRIRS